MKYLFKSFILFIVLPILSILFILFDIIRYIMLYMWHLKIPDYMYYFTGQYHSNNDNILFGNPISSNTSYLFNRWVGHFSVICDLLEF